MGPPLSTSVGEVMVHAGVLVAFGRRDEQQAPVGANKQLTVEQVGCDGVCEARVAFAYDYWRKPGSDLRRKFGEHRVLIDVGVLVAEQHGALADTDDVVVEYARIDRHRILLRKYRTRRRQSMSPRNGHRRLGGLPRRIASGRQAATEAMFAIDEELDTRRVPVRCESRMVGRTFVAHLRRCGQGIVYREVRSVRKNRAKELPSWSELRASDGSGKPDWQE